MLQRRFMFEGQRHQATIDAAERQLALVCIEAAKIGIQIDEKGEGKPMDHFVKKAWDIVNFRALSTALTGKPGNITRDIIPQKYAKEVNDTVNAMARNLKNIHKRRYEKAGRERKRKELLEKSKKEANRIKKINRKLFAE